MIGVITFTWPTTNTAFIRKKMLLVVGLCDGDHPMCSFSHMTFLTSHELA